jgi:hypothetical protein
MKLGLGTVLVLGVILGASEVSAQVIAKRGNTTTSEVCFEEKAGLSKWLTERYLTGDWSTLQGKLASVLAAANPEISVPKRGESTIVLWTGARPGKDEPEILRVVLGAASPYSRRLPGVRLVRELAIVDSPDSSLASIYVFQPTKNPLSESWIALTKKLPLGGISDVLEMQLVTEAGENQERFKPIAATCAGSRAWMLATDYALVGDRGIVSAESIVSAPASIAKAAARVLRSTRYGQGRVSACATELASRLAKDSAALGALWDQDWPSLAPAAQLALQEGDPTLKDLVRVADDEPVSAKEFFLRRHEQVVSQALCTGELGLAPELALAGSSAVQETLKAFLGVLNADEVRGSETFENVPLQHWSLGLMAAAVFEESGAERAKIDSGVVVRDPLGGVLAIGTLYWHPWAFDPGAERPTSAERWRAFIGAVVSPEPGLAVGVALQAFRGLTINVGYGSLLVQSPKTGMDFGDSAEGGNSPLSRQRADVAFVGFGYNF